MALGEDENAAKTAPLRGGLITDSAQDAHLPVWAVHHETLPLSPSNTPPIVRATRQNLTLYSHGIKQPTAEGWSRDCPEDPAIN